MKWQSKNYEMTIYKMTVDEMTIFKMTLDEMTIYKMTVDEMTLISKYGKIYSVDQ